MKHIVRVRYITFPLKQCLNFREWDRVCVEIRRRMLGNFDPLFFERMWHRNYLCFTYDHCCYVCMGLFTFSS